MPGVYAPQDPPPKPEPKTSKDVKEFTPSTAPDASVKTLDTPPPVRLSGVDERGHYTKADPESLRTFAASLDAYVQPLKDTSDRLRGVNLKPGHFNAATKYKSLIGGVENTDEGLVDTYLTNVGKVTGALTAMVTALKKLADRYDTADGLANANANDVQSVLSGVPTAMGQNAPSSVPGYTPPDDKKDDKKDDK